MAQIELDGINRIFQLGDSQVHALRDVSLRIEAGEYVAVMGPSGSGKSTLLNLLGLLDRPNAGHYRLEGRDVTTLSADEQAAVRSARIGFVFQSFHLVPRLTAAENVALPLMLAGIPPQERTSRVTQALKDFGLEPRAHHRPEELSGGQRQRVALARSLAKRPKVLLLDEPLGALDRKLREETQFELMDIQQSLGLTFLIVTHDQEEAMITADRIAVMRAGQLAQIGRPAEVYEAPNSRYVADFIGDVNLFEARVTEDDGDIIRLVSPEAPEGLEAIEDDAIPIGSTAWLAVRPEKMRVHLDPPPAGPNRLEGTVADIGYLGDWTTYLVELPGGRTIRAARANASRVVDRPVDWDDKVWLTFAPDSAVVLTQ